VGDGGLCSAPGGGDARKAGDAGEQGSWWSPRASNAVGVGVLPPAHRGVYSRW
jgi:hypothetical protein